MSESARVDYDEPDWLAESPVSEKAHQQTLSMLDPQSEQEAHRQASIAAYTAGFFEGEGSIQFGVSRCGRNRMGYHMTPTVEVEQVARQMAGLFDAEGAVMASVSRGATRVGHVFMPEVELGQVRDKTLLEHIFDRYQEVAEFGYNTRQKKREGNRQPMIAARARAFDDVEAFLRPLIPLLYEKRRQALIMVDEILPRLRQGVHLSKRGFIEMMEWKEKLDEAKPKGNKDRKYTVDYFRELWADELESQKQLGDGNWGGNDDE